MLPTRVTIYVVTITTTLWGANLIADMIPSLGYESDPFVHGVFMTIVGGVLGLHHRRGGAEPPKPPPAATEGVDPK